MSEPEREESTFASAPGIGAKIGALNLTTLGFAGWLITVVGLVGVLLIAVSYVGGWLTISADRFGEPETASMGMAAATSGPMWLLYRIATLATVGCAVAVVFVPRSIHGQVWLCGLTTAGLSLLTTAMATFVIGAALSRAVENFGIDSGTPGVRVGYGWGMYASYAGILCLGLFIASFNHLARHKANKPSAVSQ